MVDKLSRLPGETQLALQQFACLGNLAGITTLSTVLAIAEKQVHMDLCEAVCQGLVERLESAYRFMHDRIQEAAYSMIPKAMRAEVHLRIGHVLVARTPAGKREEAIFEIVNQLNRGAALITQQEERNQLAELNLMAGKRAKASAAYGSALTYLNFGLELLAENPWDRQHLVVFALELNRAECEFLTGQLSVADERLATLSNHAMTTVEHAIVACLHIDVCTTFGQSSRAIVVGLNCLRYFGIAWTPHPKHSEVRREYERIWSALGDRAIEDLIDLPLMEDSASLAAIDVLSKLTPPAVFTDENLASLMICKAISLSLERGNCDASCLAYVQLARIAGPRFGDYQAGFRFGRLGYDLVGRRGLKRFEARTFVCFAHFVMPWMEHVAACRDLLRRSFGEANRIGDPVFAVGASCHLNAAQLFAGEPLPEVQSEAERGLAFVDKARFGLDLITTQLALMRMLRGLTPTFGCLDDGQFSEHRTEYHLSSNPGLAFAACWYWIRKLQARCIAADYVTALDAAAKAKALLWTTTSFFEEAEYYFYRALSHAGRFVSAPSGERPEHMNALTAHHRQLKVWAEHCPENFESRAALVGAEIARIEDRSFDAMRLYQLAIRSAHANGFWHVEALANEIAARFYAALEFEVIAEAYLQNARYCYLRWRADGKVRQLEQEYPHLRTGELAPGSTGTIATPVEHLDLATVIKVSQAVSGDIVLDKLIETVMRTAVEHAGAEQGLLIIPEDGEQRIAAEATTGGERVAVHLRDAPVTPAAMPESVLYYVLRTRESVILDDAVADSSFAADSYIRQHRARSILCLPLMNQAKLTGVLYFENNLATRVFTPARIAVLRLVASQAAILLEIARLYRDVAKREEKIRRLVDANIIGIMFWDDEGEILEANDAFLRTVGYQRDDLVAGRLRWTDLTPPEWRERDKRALREIVETGRAQTFQKEYIKRDGSRVPVMLGAAAFETSRKEGVAFVLDLTERKQAEEKVRESERLYREAQTELSHANRVATMGQLTASIAHEVNQPIAATITNAQAGLRWLRAQPPNLNEVEQVLGRIIKDTNRAGDVLSGIRALVKKAPPQREPVDINKAILEIIELTRGEAWKHGASVQTHLADGLPLIEGDRVQLQQVLLNLCINAMEAMSGVSDGVREFVIRTKMADAGCVLVAVSDSGPGFGPESAERVFTPFYTTKSTGLGMGLSICRSIIEAHGGQLWASENVPRGAIFQFTVPALPSIS